MGESYFEDIGGYQADIDMYESYMANHVQPILDDRKRRLKRLAGQYVVIIDGKSSRKPVFYQDRNVSDKGYWTQFLSNAQGYRNLQLAKTIARKFSFGNPRVAYVDIEGIYRVINSDNL